MYKLVFIVLAVVFANIVKAKDTTIVLKDPRLDVLTTKQAQINKRSSMMTSSGLYKGYRIQVLSTQSRGEAFKMKTDLLTRFPEEKTYLMFQSPNFKVRLGNYLKRSDAEKVRQQLNTLLGRNAYVVEDAIEYTPKEGDGIFL